MSDPIRQPEIDAARAEGAAIRKELPKIPRVMGGSLDPADWWVVEVRLERDIHKPRYRGTLNE